MIWARLIPWAGYPLAALCFGLWLSARDAVIEEREACNADKLTTALEHERKAREALAQAASNREAALQAEVDAERRAATIAREAAIQAESRPPRVRTVIKEVASESECINTDVPAALVDSVFND